MIKIVVHSAIDNLLKGASGQAVQNMNLMFGLEEGNRFKIEGELFLIATKTQRRKVSQKFFRASFLS